MVVHHRAAVVLGLAGLSAATIIGVRSMSQTPSPGASISWAPQAASTTVGSSPAPAGALPLATASPGAPPASNSLGGLQVPLSAMFQQLNAETRNTAVGQYAILRDIGDAIRGQIVRFLNWISSGH